MKQKKLNGVKVSKAYEQGKKDALAYRKLNPQPSKWVRFLGLAMNSNLRKKYEVSYQLGYFEIINERKEQEKQEQQAKKQVSQKPDPNVELLEIDRGIKQLERRRKLILAIERQKEKAKER